MGEAKRRRLNGAHPSTDDAFEAVRRFWQGEISDLSRTSAYPTEPSPSPSMSRVIRHAHAWDGKAHISWHVGPDGLAMALAEGFVDMEGWAALAPQDSVTVYSRPSDKEPMH
jgi:hypothetical protein